MSPFIATWLIGEGIIVYRTVKNFRSPPGPGALLLSSGVFVLLSLLADASPGARKLAVSLAWGFDIAALMNLWGTGGPKAGTGNKYWPPPIAPATEVFPGGTPATPTNAGPSSTSVTPPKITQV